MLGEKHHSHAARSQAVEHFVIAKHQAVRGAGYNPLILIIGKQPGVDERTGKLVGVGVVLQMIALLYQEFLRSMGRQQPQAEQLVEEGLRMETHPLVVFRDGPVFTLLVDIKSEAESTYAALREALSGH